MTAASLLEAIAALAALALIAGAGLVLLKSVRPAPVAKQRVIEVDGDIAPAKPLPADAAPTPSKPSPLVLAACGAAFVCGGAVLARAALGTQAGTTVEAPIEPVEVAEGPRNYSSDLYDRLPAADVRAGWDIFVRACLTNDEFTRQIDRLKKAGFDVPRANQQNADRLAFSPRLANTIVYYDESAQEAAETVSIFLEREMNLRLKAMRGDPALIPQDSRARTLKVHLIDPRCREGG
ncbi:MAG: hypothetical protein AAF127_01900 [Pseudomonadota bacterium]